MAMPMPITSATSETPSATHLGAEDPARAGIRVSATAPTIGTRSRMVSQGRFISGPPRNRGWSELGEWSPRLRGVSSSEVHHHECEEDEGGSGEDGERVGPDETVLE